MKFKEGDLVRINMFNAPWNPMHLTLAHITSVSYNETYHIKVMEGSKSGEEYTSDGNSLLLAEQNRDAKCLLAR